jgi:hypothetical protein
VTDWPAAVTVVGDADFVTVMPFDWVTPTVAIEAFEVVVVPFGALPVPVPVSVIEPLSMSACVTVYVAVQVTDAPGANVIDPFVWPGPQLNGDRLASSEGADCTSLTPMFVSVTLPEFVTWKEYVTVWFAAVTVVGDAVFSMVSAAFCVAVTVT